ncbi:MAG TPA: c-type cytochrome [Pyrinomonadaceae bacterium]
MRLRLLTVLLSVTALGSVSFSAKSERGTGLPDFAATPAQSPAPQSQTRPAHAQEQAAEQVFKNIQVLKGVPASQIQPTMAFITGALGVRCSHCHTSSAFERDDKATKQTARRMMRMVLEINRGNFDGAAAVSCNTCHRGQTRPQSVPTLGRSLWLPSAAVAKPDAAAAALPTVEQILDNYVRAAGGREALAKITSRVFKGSRVGADGVLVPEEVQQKAPNKLLVTTSYPQIVFRRGFDGTMGWARDSQGGGDIGKEELAELAREAEFYKEVRLRELYAGMSVEGRATVGEREAYVIVATTREGASEKLFFDTQTGLLVRKYTEIKLVLGAFPTQTDYEDYREVDGVRVPFVIRWSIPGRAWGRKIEEVKTNVHIDDATFRPPAAAGGERRPQ